jgi:hypothetical protein
LSIPAAVRGAADVDVEALPLAKRHWMVEREDHDTPKGWWQLQDLIERK